MLHNLLPKIKTVTLIEDKDRHERQNKQEWKYFAEPTKSSAYTLNLDEHIPKGSGSRIEFHNTDTHPYFEPNERKILGHLLPVIDAPLSKSNRGLPPVPEIDDTLITTKKKTRTKTIRIPIPEPSSSLVLNMMNCLPNLMELFIQRNRTIYNVTLHGETACSRVVAYGAQTESTSTQGGSLIDYGNEKDQLTFLFASVRYGTITMSRRQEVKTYIFSTKRKIGIEIEMWCGIKLICSKVLEGHQAYEHRVSLDGAEIVALNGRRVETFEEFRHQLEYVRAHDSEIVLLVASYRGGKGKLDDFIMNRSKNASVKSLFGNVMMLGLDREHQFDVDLSSQEDDPSQMEEEEQMSDKEATPVKKKKGSKKAKYFYDSEEEEEEEEEEEDEEGEGDGEGDDNISVDTKGSKGSRMSKGSKGRPNMHISSNDSFDGEDRSVQSRGSKSSNKSGKSKSSKHRHALSRSASNDSASKESLHLNPNHVLDPSSSSSSLHGVDANGTETGELDGCLMRSSSDEMDDYETMVASRIKPSKVSIMNDASTAPSSSVRSINDLENMSADITVESEGTSQWDFPTALSNTQQRQQERLPFMTLVCMPEYLQKSMEWGEPKTFLQVSNFSSKWELELYWVDSDGALVPRAEINRKEKSTHFELTGCEQVWVIIATLIKEKYQRSLSSREENRNSSLVSAATDKAEDTVNNESLLSSTMMVVRPNLASLTDNKCTSCIWTPLLSVSTTQRMHPPKTKGGGDHNPESNDGREHVNPHMHIQVFDGTQQPTAANTAAASSSNSSISLSSLDADDASDTSEHHSFNEPKVYKRNYKSMLTTRRV